MLSVKLKCTGCSGDNYAYWDAANGYLSDPEDVIEATSLKLLGNASSHTSWERRKVTIANVNILLVDMTEEYSAFDDDTSVLCQEGN